MKNNVYFFLNLIFFFQTKRCLKKENLLTKTQIKKLSDAGIQWNPKSPETNKWIDLPGDTLKT